MIRTIAHFKQLGGIIDRSRDQRKPNAVISEKHHPEADSP